jgi:hypothetical protein
LPASSKTVPSSAFFHISEPLSCCQVAQLAPALSTLARGPVLTARILDMSPAGASRLGVSGRRVREVTLEVVESGSGKTTRAAHK